MALTKITLAEIERVFEVLERLGISREAVVIPLRPESPGRMRILPNGKAEIVLDAERALDDFLRDVEAWLGEQMRG
jgi:hypothetical protein